MLYDTSRHPDERSSMSEFYCLEMPSVTCSCALTNQVLSPETGSTSSARQVVGCVVITLAPVLTAWMIVLYYNSMSIGAALEGSSITHAALKTFTLHPLIMCAPTWFHLVSAELRPNNQLQKTASSSAS